MNWTMAQATAALRRAGVKDAIPQACGEPPKRNKHGNVHTWVDGIRFHSGIEARHYQSLKIAEGAGLISELRLQPRYELQAKFTDSSGIRYRAVHYVGDFEFLRKDGKRICADSKGIEAAGFRVKFKLAIKKYPEIQFEVWK